MATCKDCFHWNACKKMLEAMWGHSVPSGYEGGADRCEDFISAADVAPWAEVAREVIEAIEALMFAYKKYSFSEIYYEHGLANAIAELKKKYTEGRDG